MSLGNWEGWRRVEAESGELPIHHSPLDLREIGRRIKGLFLILQTQEKGFFIAICVVWDTSHIDDCLIWSSTITIMVLALKVLI